MKDKHVIWHERAIERVDFNKMNKHKSGLVWFTGLSGSGKSTIAHAVQHALFEKSVRAYVLDGDNVRHGLNSNLGFDRDDRKENLRRIVELSKLFVDAGILVLAAFISPYHEDRQFVRDGFGSDDFLEVYVKCSIEECENRDPKGQYEKARKGIIKNYTGISSPYEEPENADLVINTETMEMKESVDTVLDLIKRTMIE
ncbi:MAG: adenylyl-sulfate kinase [Candidatus Brocadiales bacterium]|nr:adenylyl-sulfate kinase [Candidatus Brocadiales bacterium]